MIHSMKLVIATTLCALVTAAPRRYEKDELSSFLFNLFAVYLLRDVMLNENYICITKQHISNKICVGPNKI